MNENGDIVTYCKNKRKKGNDCAAKIKRSANGSTCMTGMHRKHCVSEVFDTDNKIDNCSNVVLHTLHKLALNNMSMTPTMVWQENNADLD